MQDNWAQIRDFYSRNGIFGCAQRGHGEGHCKVDVANQLYRGASERAIDRLAKQMAKPLPPSYRRFLRFSNGAVLLTQKKDLGNQFIAGTIFLVAGLFQRLRKRVFDCESGFQLYSASEIPLGHREVVSWLGGLAEDPVYFDENEQVEKQHCTNWLGNILVIGEELNSGNYMAIDFTRPPQGEEYPIIMLNHELPFSEAYLENEDAVIAASVDDLLLKAAQDPAKFLMETLGSTACYIDGKTWRQWGPETYEQMPPGQKARRYEEVEEDPVERKARYAETMRVIKVKSSLPHIDHVTDEQIAADALEKLAPDQVIREELQRFSETARDEAGDAPVTQADTLCAALEEQYTGPEATDPEKNVRTVVAQLHAALTREERRHCGEILVIINHLLMLTHDETPPPTGPAWTLLHELGSRLFEARLNECKGDRRMLAIGIISFRSRLFPESYT